MKTTIPNQVGIFSLLLLLSFPVMAQIAPYAITPKWMFGYQAGMDFTGGAPVLLAGNPSTNLAGDLALENSTSICDPSKNLAFYSNAIVIYNGATNAVVRDMNTADLIAGSSSTGATIAIPDPAAPTTQFYLFIANDMSGGLRPNKGIHYYRLTKTGATVTVTAGPTLLAGSTSCDESITAGTDGVGGYWLVSHEVLNNYFWVWHITAAGLSAVDRQVHSPYVGGTVQGSVKFNKCQDRIGWTGNNSLVVYRWNRSTGKIDNSSPVFSNVTAMGASGAEPTYGLEFSPDGTKVYHTVLGDRTFLPGVLRQVDLGTGALTVVDNTGSANGGSREVGSMQLGPDGKIYVAQSASYSTNAAYVGVINTPNNTIAGGVGYNKSGFLLKPANAASEPSNYRGLINLAWLSPSTPVINISGTCTVNFSFDFKTYFTDNISINASSIRWDFNNDGTNETAFNGNATPSFDYSTLGTGVTNYTARLTFTDQSCGQTWTVTRAVPTNCPLPVVWQSVSISASNTGNLLRWTTSAEDNNSHFVVQRSADGISFEDLTTIAGAGTNQSVTSYSYLDPSFNQLGSAYYRIAQVDFDGTTTFSKVVSLQGSGQTLQVYPNPSHGSFVVEFAAGGYAQLVITDMMGRTVYSGSVTGDFVQTRVGQDLAKGSYVLSVITDAGTMHERLEKE